jgi:putative endonuclease
MSEWYIYLIRCRDGSLYTGITTNVERRFAQHQKGGAVGSKYLKGRGPLVLAFQRKIGTRSLALKMEIHFKQLSRENKEKLIVSDDSFPNLSI